MDNHASPQGPEDHERLAEDYPSPDVSTQLDMSTELAHQAAAQAIEAAAAASAVAQDLRDAQNQLDLDDIPLSNEVAPSSSHITAGIAGSYSTPGVAGPSTPSAVSNIPQNQQIAILREAYARNPNPTRREYEVLADKTGRPWPKIREYFRQRRNKGRGLSDLDLIGMEEPGRASGWLQMAYRPASSTRSVSQLALYSAYKSRFDPYSVVSPLLGGQALIQLAIASFPGCEMAKEEQEYILKGMAKRAAEDGDSDGGDAAEIAEAADEGDSAATQVLAPTNLAGISGGGLDTAQSTQKVTVTNLPDQGQQDQSQGDALDQLPEPLRAGTWLLGDYQALTDASLRGSSPPPSTLTQTDLYSAYAARFALPSMEGFDELNPDEEDGETQEAVNTSDQLPISGEAWPEASSKPANGDQNHEASGSSPVPSRQVKKETNRILDPVELIHLARMTFPDCEPAVDEEGRFVIRGIEPRRRAIRSGKGDEMFPFALMSEPDASDPSHPLISLLKRKLEQFEQDTESMLESRGTAKREKRDRGELAPEEKELVEGLKRFKSSRFGEEVRDICVNQ